MSSYIRLESSGVKKGYPFLIRTVITMLDSTISSLERLAKIQPQLTILILMIAIFGNDILSFISSFFEVFK